jgi:transposase
MHQGIKEETMPNRRTKMRKIKETLRLHFEAGMSNAAIARSLRISKGSVFNTLERFKTTKLPWPLPADIDEAQLEAALYPGKDEKTEAEVKTKPDYAYIAREVCRPHVTRQLLYEEFRNDFPDGVGRSVFYDGFRKYMNKHDLQMRTDYKGGDKLFIDYSGDGLSYIDRETGEVVPTQLYVSSWGASSYTYAEATHTQRGEEWVNSHVRMQEFYGCVAGALVPDNLKSGVIKPSWYEPDLNPLYYEMAKHYGTVILPARVKNPRDKAVVESNVLHLQRFILGRLRNRTFFSLPEINHAVRELLEDYNNRPMKEYGGQSRRQRFLELDKPYARPLPVERFTISKMKDGILVGPDYHVTFDSHHYSVPYTLVKERVTVYQTGNLIEIYHKGNHVVRHRKQPPNYRHTTVTEHMPAHHQFVKGIRPSWLIFKGGEIGPGAAEAIKCVLKSRQHPEQGYKSSLGILRLAKKYSPERTEKACQRALYFKSVSYRSIKTILAKNLDDQSFGETDLSEPDVPPTIHENLRGSQYYAQG